VLVLCGLTIGLSFLFGCELRQRTRMQAELARLSLTDVLTGLPNRRRFEDEIARAWTGPPDPAAMRSMLAVDVDHFKAINDRYGHGIGDAVLRGLAACLSAGIRRPGDLACRIGGEEFVMLLAATDLASAHRVADRVHAEVARLALPAAGIPAGALTVSIGIAGSAGGGDGPGAAADLYRAADGALYSAKAHGRNRTCAAPRPSRAAVPAGSPAWDYAPAREPALS